MREDHFITINYTAITAVIFIVILCVTGIYVINLLNTIADKNDEIDQLKYNFVEFSHKSSVMTALDGAIAYDEDGHYYRFDNTSVVTRGFGMMAIDIKTDNIDADGMSYRVDYKDNFSVVFHLKNGN
jgi:hypothetical protein